MVGASSSLIRIATPSCRAATSCDQRRAAGDGQGWHAGDAEPEVVGRTALTVKDDLRGIVLFGQDLRGIVLAGRDLSKANLAEARLDEANLSERNLTEANLEVAYLERVNLGGANLARAELTNTVLVNAHLMGADLTEARLAGAYLEGAALRRANLFGARLTLAELTRASLIGASLQKADLTEADLTAVNGPHSCEWNIVTVSIRQRIVPDQLLGRVNAGYRLAAWGTMPLGAALGGIIANTFGIPTALITAAAISSICTPIVYYGITTDLLETHSATDRPPTTPDQPAGT